MIMLIFQQKLVLKVCSENGDGYILMHSNFFILIYVVLGIPKPTLHWLKDGKQIKQLDDTNLSFEFGSASDLQVTSDFAIAHFSKDYAGNVSIFHS